MLVFGVDSSTSFVTMGIVEDQKTLGEISFPFTRDTLGKWIFWLDFLLKECKVEIEKIDAFACVCGPGAFTNLRLGLSSIKGLAFSLQKPVVAFSSLDIYAERIPFPCLRVLVPSTQGSFFYSVYENKNRLFPPLLGTVEEILQSVSHEEIWTGPNESMFLSLCVPKNISLIPVTVGGSFVASLGAKKLLSNETIDAVSVNLEYLRGARAQEKKYGPILK